MLPGRRSGIYQPCTCMTCGNRSLAYNYHNQRCNQNFLKKKEDTKYSWMTNYVRFCIMN